MKYDKFWQFTRSPEYLNLLEQEKIGKAPTFGKQSSETLSSVSQVIRASAGPSFKRKEDHIQLKPAMFYPYLLRLKKNLTVFYL